MSAHIPCHVMAHRQIYVEQNDNMKPKIVSANKMKCNQQKKKDEAQEWEEEKIVQSILSESSLHS